MIFYVVTMICELNVWGNFFITWFALSVVGWVSLMALSGICFFRYYVKPTYEDWRYKSNPEFPEPQKIKEEITLMTTGTKLSKLCSIFRLHANSSGLFAATLCPSLALYLAQHGLSKGNKICSQYHLFISLIFLSLLWF